MHETPALPTVLLGHPHYATILPFVKYPLKNHFDGLLSCQRVKGVSEGRITGLHVHFNVSPCLSKREV